MLVIMFATKPIFYSPISVRFRIRMVQLCDNGIRKFKVIVLMERIDCMLYNSSAVKPELRVIWIVGCKIISRKSRKSVTHSFGSYIHVPTPCVHGTGQSMTKTAT